MNGTHSFRGLAFLLRITPTPRTQSESGAIFRALQDLGPISTFQLASNTRNPTTTTHNDEAQDSTAANLVFAHNTGTVDRLRNGAHERTLRVVANANIPSASVKDPYNVRGLQNRKPELDPREFHVEITPAEGPSSNSREEAIVLHNQLEQNEYRGPFAVDRSSIFAEILAKTDCPSGLIHGLLPKLKDEYPVASDAEGARARKQRSEEEEARQADRENALDASKPYRNVRDSHKHRALQEGRKTRKGTQLVRLDLSSEQDSEDTSSAVSGDVKPNTAVRRNPARFKDEFAALRGFSLMGMYREGLAKNQNRSSKSDGN